MPDYKYSISFDVPDNVDVNGFLESISKPQRKIVMFEMMDGSIEKFSIIDADLKITEEGYVKHILTIKKID